MEFLPWLRVMASVALLGGCGGTETEGSGGGGVGGEGPKACGAGEATAPDGSCIAAGVSACAPELEATGDGGCNPILPPAACEKGSMAPVGEATCRPVAPCGDARFPIDESDASAEFVDAAYDGDDSDGTAARPWLTIQDGIDAADPGATVAIAAGEYASLWNKGKQVVVRGRCPDLVRVVGSAAGYGAVDVSGGGDGTVIRGLSVEGAGFGVVTSGVTGVVFDELWIHDTADRGLDVDDAAGATGFTLSGSLVEATTGIGAFVAGATATFDRTVIRDTAPKADLSNGMGVLVRPGVTDAPATLEITRTVVERNLIWGVMVLGSTATIDASVVRDNLVQANRPIGGRGISIGNGNGNGEALPDELRATVTISRSVVERNVESGIFVRASDVVVTDTVVRDMKENPVDMSNGLGVYAKEQSVVELRSSLVDRTRVVGVYIRDSQAIIASTLVRDTLPSAADGQLGDGISILSLGDLLAGATIDASRVVGSTRAGLSSFSARVELGGSLLDCNTIDLDGETLDGAFAFDFVDGGGNVCPCADDSDICQVQTANLAPPTID